ncbi:pyridoxamine 5'-phosphate oxidase family protein [Guptibacillus algicola]|uniref:pyridoxamine 5'-phosphate oxidase family protein n=1 Tax=Guptibacillus algicola TaxID=225844 RepID=UPI001CD3D105|nr:pyridoxamine 5'-phosphate oxidase family protein [Alkalihalobacillus algicola]MCA0986436.1 pyridoxamine 5'-phosphate oxidase family protein [Alkalihalobacillus algicola]
MPDVFLEKVQTVEELQSIGGEPSKLAANKVINFMDENCELFISHSPFLTIATSSSEGSDVSPRGDQPGFVKVIDQRHLLIPERPGNKRMDSLRNILENPNVGLLFIVPGREETLRINGKACIVKDQLLLEDCEAFGKIPLLGIGIEVKECFIHCGKALKRSHLFEQEYWPSIDSLPSAAKMLADHSKLESESVSKSLIESYTERLY